MQGPGNRETTKTVKVDRQCPWPLQEGSCSYYRQFSCHNFGLKDNILAA